MSIRLMFRSSALIEKVHFWAVISVVEPTFDGSFFTSHARLRSQVILVGWVKLNIGRPTKMEGNQTKIETVLLMETIMEFSSDGYINRLFIAIGDK
jgi:hypothetical protein